MQSPSPSLQIKEQPPSPGSPQGGDNMYAAGGTQIYLQVNFCDSIIVTWRRFKVVIYLVLILLHAYFGIGLEFFTFTSQNSSLFKFKNKIFII